MRTQLYSVTAATLLVSAGAAVASNQPGTAYNQWLEAQTAVIENNGSASVADAGNLIVDANITAGAGGLATINGTLQHTRDVDVYAITITNPTVFSAKVPGASGTGDSQLSLYTPAGNGIAWNDNDPTSPSGVGSTLSAGNPLTASLAPGLYYLAISRWAGVGFGSVAQVSLGAAGSSDPLFDNTNRGVEVGPLNPSDVLSGWANDPTPGFDLFNYSYTITLTGADYAVAPAPGAGLLISMGSLLVLRRRR